MTTDSPESTVTEADVRAGFRFVHPSILDPNWTPGPGQKYADAPRATMRITRRSGQSIWFGYDPDGPSIYKTTVTALVNVINSGRAASAGIGEEA